jgi:hypothetical protein
MEAELALAAIATLCLGVTLTISVWMQMARLRPSAFLEEKRFVPWDDVISYGWRGEVAATVEVKISSWTGSTSLHFLRVPAEKKQLVEQILQRFAPGRGVAVPA